MSGDERDAHCPALACLCCVCSLRDSDQFGEAFTQDDPCCMACHDEMAAPGWPWRGCITPPASAPREEPWEWHPDGPEAHAMLERVQDEEGGR